MYPSRTTYLDKIKLGTECSKALSEYCDWVLKKSDGIVIATQARINGVFDTAHLYEFFAEICLWVDVKHTDIRGWSAGYTIGVGKPAKAFEGRIFNNEPEAEDEAFMQAFAMRQAQLC